METRVAGHSTMGSEREPSMRRSSEVTRNVALTCASTRSPGRASYVWFRRYEEFGGRRSPESPLTAAREPKNHSRGGRRQDHLSAPELPLRAAQDRDVWRAASGI
jgi:hypothetical protein